MYICFCGVEWEILGRIRVARFKAEVEDVPGEECSVRIVVLWAMHALQMVLLVIGFRMELMKGGLTRAEGWIEWKRMPW